MGRKEVILLLWLQAVLGVLGQGPTIEWEMGMFGVREGDGFVDVCATVSELGGNLTVETATTELTANEGVDYEALSGSGALLSWTSNNNRSCVRVTVLDDDMVENEELFFVNVVRVVESSPPVFPTFPPGTIVMIMNDDAIQLVFTEENVVVTDDTGTMEVCVAVDVEQVTDGVSYRIPITVETINGTAEPDVDFDPFNNMTVGGDSRGVLTPLNPEECFVISVLARPDDGLDDRNFFFMVSLLEGAKIEPSPEEISTPANLEVTVQPSAQISVGDIVDSILSNPLYSVAIDREGDSDTNLCYEIHGERGAFLNLVSDVCFSINARYDEIEGISGQHEIAELMIRTSDVAGSCVDILIYSEDNCSSVFVRSGGPAFDHLDRRFRRSGIQIDFVKSYIEILLPCAAYPGGGIKVIVECPLEFYNSVTETFHAVRHLNLQFNRAKLPDTESPFPHGLLGQFWHLDFTTEKFTGQFRNGRTLDNAVTVYTPADLTSHAFVSLSYFQTWDQREEECLYAGNKQGGASYYVTEPADSVIQGDYSDYKVLHHFDTEFTYSVFDNAKYGCPAFPSIPIRILG